MLQQLVQQVNRTPLNEKDPDAEALLKDGLARDPDALYKLAQIVLVQDISLHQAQARIQQLTAESQQQPAPQQPARASSFLGNLFHRDEPAPSSQASGSTPQYQPVPNTPPPAPQYAQPQYPPQTQYAQPSQGSSFLRSAATTAAGVAAGALAFEGIESIFHRGFGGGYGFGGFGSPMGFGGGMPVEETIINNNYIEDPSQNMGLNNQDFQQQNPFDNASFDNNQGFDNNSGFDNGFDDSGSFDDGGFDSGNDLI